MQEEEFQIERMRTDGDAALGDAFLRHEDRLDRIIAFHLDPRLSGRVDPADVLQEAFLEAKKRIARYLSDPSVPVFVWLRGVVLDTLIHVHRRHLAGKRDAGIDVSIEAGGTQSSPSNAIARRLVADQTSPSHAAVRNETIDQLQEVLEGMEPIDREVLSLRHFEHLSNDEVADVIGVKKAAASRRYMRALQHLECALRQIPGCAGFETVPSDGESPVS